MLGLRTARTVAALIVVTLVLWPMLVVALILGSELLKCAHGWLSGSTVLVDAPEFIMILIGLALWWALRLAVPTVDWIERRPWSVPPPASPPHMHR